MRAIIFANGYLESIPPLISQISQKDLIIAADGGLRHCNDLNIIPNLIIGDLDSIHQNDLLKMKSLGVEIIKYHRRKDETDLELSLKMAIERGADDVLIIGALGGRWDMTFSNVLILAADFLKGITVKIMDGNQEIFCIRDGQQINITNHINGSLSLLPLSETVEKISLNGMEYLLNEEPLSQGTSRGLSNIIIENEASIHVTKGKLLVMIDG